MYFLWYFVLQWDTNNTRWRWYMKRNVRYFFRYFPQYAIIDLSLWHALLIYIRLFVNQLLNPFPRRVFHIVALTAYENAIYAPACRFFSPNRFFSSLLDWVCPSSCSQHIQHIYYIMRNRICDIISPLLGGAGRDATLDTVAGWRGLCLVFFLPNNW